jgi:hypothetical protein
LAASTLALALTYGVSFGDGSCVKSLAVIGTSRRIEQVFGAHRHCPSQVLFAKVRLAD